MKALLGRRQFALSGLVMLAACAAPPKRPVFKKYAGPPVTEVRVYKAQRHLQLLSGDTVLKSYRVGLGNEPIGHKQKATARRPKGSTTLTASTLEAAIICRLEFLILISGTKPMPQPAIEMLEVIS